MKPTGACKQQKFAASALKCFLALLMLLSSGPSVFGQLSSFEFLNVPAGARMAALGGINVSLADRDVNFFYSNPAINAGDTLSGVASVNYHFFVGDIGHSAVTYADNFKRIGPLSFGIQHMNYGMIQGYDPSGAETGEFKSQETAILIGKSHQIRHYRFGASIKGVFSSIAGYRAGAVALDLGGIFVHPKQQLTVGLAIKNIGLVISEYSESSASRLPFDVQIGTTFKPEYMPLRFSLTAYNLVKGESMLDQGTEQYSGLQQVLSHLNFAGEILVHKNVNVLVGYNYLNHQELKLENGGGGAGISLGFSVSIKSVDLVVSRSAYVAGNATYSFTLSTNLKRYLKRR